MIDAGLVWVGPKPASITAMGLKDAAKTLMAEAGVPVTPGYLGANQDPDHLASEAGKIGYPVLIKAVAGGGGKGMRLVEKADDFADSLTSCQREAASSFGNAHVLIEKYIQRPRHIEVQVFGDSHGNVVHLFERDCSLQRRHQKVIEEAPAPGMDEATAQRAVRGGGACGQGGGLCRRGDDRIHRRRVGRPARRPHLVHGNEHPAAGRTSGDRGDHRGRSGGMAAAGGLGRAIPLRQEELSINGWAMEARLYAEDPAKGFLPSIGTLELFELGEADGANGRRIDTGVEEGAEVSPFYDPMIAKVIAHGTSRDEARETLADMLDDSAVWPVRTNAAFLLAALAHPEFAAGEVDTGLIGRDGEAMAADPSPSDEALSDAAMGMVPSGIAAGFRLNAATRNTAKFLLDGAPVDVLLQGEGAETPASDILIAECGMVWHLTPWRVGGGAAAAGDGTILSPMPGKIIAVEVLKGDAVTKGQKLLTLEAMKMEHSLVAPFDGTVEELNAVAGAQVQVEALLARIVAHTEAVEE